MPPIDKPGFKPWQTRGTGQKPEAGGAAASGSAEKAQGQDPVAPPAQDKIGDDVLEAAHARKAEVATDRVTQGGFAQSLSQSDALELRGSTLQLGRAQGTQKFTLTQTQLDAMTMLPSSKLAMAAVWGGIHGARGTLITAPPGAGASHAVKWLLDVTGTKHDVARITRMTSLDQLVGAMRPDEKTNLRVKDGPLTKAIRSGGAFVVDGLENADAQVLAALSMLARSGSKVFHHPVSGEVINIHENFRLVLVSDPAKRLPPDLVANCRDGVFVPPYGEDEHRRLLMEQHGLNAQLAAQLAALHQELVDKTNDGELDFGRRFPLAWGQLERVAKRLEKIAAKEKLTPDHVAEAVNDVYGARLSAPTHKDTFADVLLNHHLKVPEPESVGKAKSPGYVITPHIEPALRAAETALDNGETLLLSGPGQCGATRLVEELAARRKQEISTIVAHAGTDPQSLIELPTFDENGRVFFRPGRVTQALLEGKLLLVDHLDHMPTERQNAFFRLQQLKTITVLEGGKLVEKPVHKNARIVITTGEGQTAGRNRVEASDRAFATEVKLPPAGLDDALRMIDVKPDVKAAVAELGADLFGDGPVKLQRFIDLARSTELIADHLPGTDRNKKIAQALEQAAHLLFTVPSQVAQKLSAKVGKVTADEKPLYQRLLNLSQKEVDARLAKTSFRLVPSVEQHLDALAIAHCLGRPVLAVGPAAAGKTVLGGIFAALLGKENIRYNFSASTEARDHQGGLAPVNVDGKTRFQEVDGPTLHGAAVEAAITYDEWNLSDEARESMKSMLDYRRVAIDAERNVERKLGTTFLYAAQNPTDVKSGRKPIEPSILDCMFVIAVNEKTVQERVEIVKGHTKIDEALLTNIAEFFGDLSGVTSKLKSTVGPITTTERDILKAAKAAEHFITRDKVKDEDEIRKIVARETYRVVADLLVDPKEKQLVFDGLIKKAFGNDLEMPQRATKVEKITVKENGKNVEYLQIGTAKMKVRELGVDKALDELVPKAKGLKEPIGSQIAVLESVLLAIETKQPLAVVGATGTGKTMLVNWLLRQLNWPVLEQPFHEDMTKDDILGAPVIKTEKGKDGGKDQTTVEFQESPADRAVLYGGAFIGDEYLTLNNDVREVLNALTEGSELTIPSRPPRTIKKDEWHEYFRFIVTTNGGDIRKANFSLAEASRLRVVALDEITDPADMQAIAQRDFAAPEPEKFELATVDVKKATNAVKALLKSDGPISEPDVKKLLEAYVAIRADDPKEWAEVEEQIVKRLALAPPELKDKAAVTIARPTNALKAALEVNSYGGQLVSADEVKHAVEVFVELRELQKSIGNVNSPLTQRVFTSFLELLASVRETAPYEQALMRAAELTLLSKMGKAGEKKALEVLDKLGAKSTDEKPTLPVITHDRVWFGDTAVKKGTERPLADRVAAAAAALDKGEVADVSKLPKNLTELKLGHGTIALVHEKSERFFLKAVDSDEVYGPFSAKSGSWEIDNQRFPFTPARCKNMSLLADAIERGRGRPIACTDDENGETVELIREMGRLTGRQVTVVTLSKNVDIEPLIQRLTLSRDPDALGTFEPELQQIGMAVLQGHMLVLRGCGSVPTTKLERLNSLGDGRQSIKLPRTGDVVEAHPDFRMIMLRKPNSPFGYSQALSNRLLEPWLSTRDAGGRAIEQRAGELAGVLRERTGVDTETAKMLAGLHTYLNEVLRQGTFASGRQVGSFLNRDAEAVALRLSWLKARGGGVADDTLEALNDLVMQVYGERFTSEGDRVLLQKLMSNPKVFGTDGNKLQLGSDPKRTPNLVRFGEWVLQADARGMRTGVPGREEVLPHTEELEAVQQKVFAALQFDEVVHLHGDSFVAEATANSVARLTTSQVVVVDGNEELNEAYLFGGLIQNQKTGKFEHHEGVIWQAQREGLTLVIKNASRIPDDVLLPLSEIAATGMVSQVVDKKLVQQPRAFRLVLQTNDGDPPLLPELAQLSTRVGCPTVADQASLQRILSHVMLGVPGGTEIAASLGKLTKDGSKALENELFSGRTPVKFDSSRAVEAAKQIARQVRSGEALEVVIADVLMRLYVRPTKGLDCEQKIASLVQAFGQKLAEGGTLEADLPPVVDQVSDPRRALLLQDYSEHAPHLTAAVIASVAEAIQNVADTPRKAKKLLEQIVDARVLPQTARDRIAKTLSKDLGPDELNALAKALNKLAPPSDQTFYDVALEFMRGARLIDVEHRQDILKRYREVFESLNSDTGKAMCTDLDNVAERFDAAGAVAKVEKTREAVRTALEKYKRRSGEHDEQLAGLFRKLVESWDFVAMSPIFKSHRVMRQEIGTLNEILGQIADAHQKRGEAIDDVKSLIDEIKSAGAVLEGVRIAEQSAELRRDLDRSSKATEEVLGNLREELVMVRKLEQAERTHRALLDNLATVKRLRGGDTAFLVGAELEIEKPRTTPEPELRVEARKRAEQALAGKVEEMRLAMLAKVQDEVAPKMSADLKNFFNDYNADDAMSLDPVEVKAREWDGALAKAEEKLASEVEKLVSAKTDELFEQLKKQDADRAAQALQGQVQLRARQVAERMRNGTTDVAADLQMLMSKLDLHRTDPKLASEIGEAMIALRQVASQASSWADNVGNVAAAFAKATVDIAMAPFRMLGAMFGGGRAQAPVEEEPPPPPKLDTSEVARQVAAVLSKIERHLEKEINALPDFTKKTTHAQATERLAEQLITADTFGELATKVARISQAVGDEKDEGLRKALKDIVGRVGGLDGGKVLAKIAELSESANTLSSQLANERGVAANVAQVLEHIVRAAESFNSQPIEDKSFKAPVKALQQAIRAVEELQDPHPLILAVKEEMDELLRLLGKSEGAVTIDTQGISSMLAGLADAIAKPNDKITSRSASITTGEDGQEDVVEHKPSSVESELEARLLTTLGTRGNDVEGSERVTELKLLQLDVTKGIETLTVAQDQIPEDDALGKERKGLIKQGLALAQFAEERVAGLEKQRDSIAGALSALEGGIAGEALGKWRGELMEAARRLEDITSHGGESYRQAMADVGRALAGLRKAQGALATLDATPKGMNASLSAIVEDARKMSSPDAKERFDELAFAWARGALPVVREACEQLEQAGAVGAASTPTGELAEVKKSIESLSKYQGRLGGPSAAGILTRTADRLTALRDALPENARASVDELAELARNKANEMNARTGGAAGERTVSDLVEAYTDVCSQLANAKKLEASHVQAATELGDLVRTLLDAPQDLDRDLEVCGRGVELSRNLRNLRSVEQNAQELDKSFGALRSALLEQALNKLKGGHETMARDYAMAVREKRGALREAVDAFLGYDPLKEKRTPTELAKLIRAASTDVVENLTGPAAALWARDLSTLRARIQAGDASTVKAEADKLLRDLDPMLRVADGVLEEAPNADERFARMIGIVDEKLQKANDKAGNRRKSLDWLTSATEALQKLTKTPTDELKATIDDIEARLFPEIIAPPAKQEEQEVVVIESAVNRMLRRQAQQQVVNDKVHARPASSASIVDLSGTGGRAIDLRGPQDVGGFGHHGSGEVPDDFETPPAPEIATNNVSGKDLGNIQRQAIGGTGVTDKSDKVRIVDVEDAKMKQIQRAIDEEIAAHKASLDIDLTPGEINLNDFEKFVEANQALVDKMAETLRQFPNTEIVFCIDQSGSCRGQSNGTTIIEQERAALAILMAAVMQSEANCAVLGTGLGTGKPETRIWSGEGSWRGQASEIHLHKPMNTRLDADTANVVFEETKKANGCEHIFEVMSRGASQFTKNANNKLLFVITDAALGDADDTRRHIDQLRAEGVGVAMLGFGAAQHVDAVAGKFGQHVTSYDDAIKQAGKLLERTVDPANSGRYKGKLDASASGIGVSTLNAPLEAAPADGLKEAQLLLEKPFVPGDDPNVVFGADGDRRAMSNLVDRATYDRALKEVERRQLKSLNSPHYKKSLQIVRDINMKHKRDAVHDALVGAISTTMPKTGGSAWEKKQLAGPLLDEDQLPMYVMGLEQGVPVMRIFKRKKAKEDVKAKVVLGLDESTSMDPEKQRAALEALFAYGDALKAVNPDIEIAVIGFSDKVRLHAGFEQTWGDELKAHILMQVDNKYQATDDERGGMEAIGLLKMAGAEVGEYIAFSDGQGMPGTKQVMRQAEQEGFGFLTVGLGPNSKGVLRFGDNGCYARNLNTLATTLPQAKVKMWERAGRLVS